MTAEERAREDRRTGLHLAALALLALVAVVPLAFTVAWLLSLDCPQTKHVVLGPLALMAVLWLMGAVISSLGHDATPEGRWTR